MPRVLPSVSRRVELFSDELAPFFAPNPFVDPSQFFNLNVRQQKNIAMSVLMARPDADSQRIGWAIWDNVPAYSFFTVTMVPQAATTPAAVSPYEPALAPSLFSTTVPPLF